MKRKNIFEDFLSAITIGDRAQVEKLLPKVDVTAQSNNALFCAAREGHLDLVERLLPLSSRPLSHEILLSAIHGCHIDVAKLLLPFYKSKRVKKDRGIFSAAVLSGNPEMTRLFLKTEPSQGMANSAIYAALIYNKHEMIEILFPLSDQKYIHSVIKEDGDKQVFGPHALARFLTLAGAVADKEMLTRELKVVQDKKLSGPLKKM